MEQIVAENDKHTYAQEIVEQEENTGTVEKAQQQDASASKLMQQMDSKLDLIIAMQEESL